MKNALAITALLSMVAALPADCRRIVRVNHHVTPVVAAVFTPIAVAVPAYSVGYSDNAGLVEEIKALRQEVAALKGEKVVMPPAENPDRNGPGEHPGLKILVKNCAACHDIRTSNKGGGFSFMSGAAVSKLSDRQALNIAREVFSGRMPKNAKLTDEEIGAIMSWLDTQK